MTTPYRGIFLADVHMSNSLPHARHSENGRTNRLDDQLCMWTQVADYLQRLKRAGEPASAVFVLGDLWDKRLLDAVTLSETLRAILQLGSKVYLLPGNHDAHDAHGSKRFTTDFFREIESKNIVALCSGPPLTHEDWLHFWPLPFDSLSNIQRQLSEIGRPKKGSHVCLFHQAVVGCKHEGWTCGDGIDPVALTENFMLSIGGHFHTSQDFGVGKGMFCGAPMQFNFGDRGEDRGFWDIRFERVRDGSVVLNRRFVSVTAPRFHQADSLEDATEVLLDAKRGDYLRVNARATHSDWLRLGGVVRGIESAANEMGVHIKVHHAPIYHHEERIKVESGASPVALPSLDDALGQYLKSSSTVIGSLDIKVLTELGKWSLDHARAKR